MKNIHSLIIFALILFSCSSSDSNPNDPENQNCGAFEGNLILGSQQEVDAFGQCNYTSIQGNLTITDYNTSGDITDLSPLSSLTTISNILNIHDVNLRNLEGLNNITSSGTLLIDNNEFLESLIGLESLQPTKIEIWDNPALASITELNINSESINGIYLSNCPLITSLSNFSNINTILSQLSIDNMSGLTSLQGLHNLNHLGSAISANFGALNISNNENLASIDALTNVETIEYGFEITNNNLLVNLDGLSNVQNYTIGNIIITENSNLLNINSLTFIDETELLRINNNASLTNLDGLANLILLNNDLNINSNPNLTDFCGLFNLVSNGSFCCDFEINNNGYDPTWFSNETCSL